MSVRNLLKRIAADNAGAAAIEYGLLLALLAIAAVGAMSGLGDQTTILWNTVKDEATAVL